MRLTTRCPRCQETFQATLAQLQLRKGFVRCPQCACIFDGYDAVVPEAAQADDTAPASGLTSASAAPLSSASASPVPPAPAQAPQVLSFRQEAASDAAPSSAAVPAVVRIRATPQAPAAGAAAVAQLHAEPAPQTPAMASRSSEPALSAAPDASAPAWDDPFSISDHAPRASAGIEPTWRETQDDAQADDAQQDDGAQPIFGESRRSQPEAPPALPDFLEPPGSRFTGWRFWFWTVLSLAGLALLLVQAAVIYRVQIASQVPASRPLLETLCGSWGCQVEYPRHLDQISILGSALRVQPNAGQADDDTSRLVLHLTLRNNDARPQQWPVLMLDLTDFSGAVVVRKHLSPGDYLPAALAQQPFAAKTDTAVRVPISVKGVKVNGYQLKPFFP